MGEREGGGAGAARRRSRQRDRRRWVGDWGIFPREGCAAGVLAIFCCSCGVGAGLLLGHVVGTVVTRGAHAEDLILLEKI
jgi:hypothetical protein